MKTKTYLFFLAFLFALSFTVTTACSDDDNDDNDDNDEMELQKDNDNDDNLEPELVCEELSCNRDGYKIYGKMYRKVSEGSKAPCVILSHSSSLTHAAMAGYAESIAEKGMSAYCFDFCGGSSESQSDGSTDEMTVFTEVDDLKAVLETVKKLTGASVVQTERCCGESGLFAVKRPDIADQVRFRKMEEIKKAKAASEVPGQIRMLTTCPGCLQGLSRYQYEAQFTTDFVVVEMARRMLGANWKEEFIREARNGGIEKIFV